MKATANIITCGLLASTFISMPAFAAMPVSFGWYLEGNAGKSISSDKSFPGTVKNTGFGWNINGGYKFTQYVAVDAGFTHYAETRVEAPAGTTVAIDEYYSYDLAAKLMVPIVNSGLDVFGKVGISRINSWTHVQDQSAANANHYTFNTGTHSETGPYFGAGAEYAIIPQLLVNLEWMRAQGTNQTGNLDLYSAGVAYIF